jgi:TPR repeat protein
MPCNLGISCFEGKGVEKCVATVLPFWQRTADLGHAESQHHVGLAHLDGDGGYAKNIQLASTSRPAPRRVMTKQVRC